MRRTFALALALAAPRAALAQRPADEARAHFARAVTLYTDANFEAALVEFQRALALSGNANVLYNVAAALESLGRFVEARDALEAYRMRGTPAAVAARAAELDARLARLRERIGTLRVLADAPGLRVRVDGAEVPTERARAGLAVSAGVRVIALDAPGFVAREERREVTGGQTVVLDEPLPRARGALDLRCDVPGAAVRVDGRDVGTTPLGASLSLDVGEHDVEVRRAGYAPFARRVVLGVEGARVEAPLPWADPLPESEGARISLRTNVIHPSVALDGRPVRGDGGQLVPPGPHRLRVERAGYVPSERPVDLRPGPNEVARWLDATPALVAAHDDRVRRARVPGYVLLATGGAMIAAGLPLLITGLADERSAADEARAIGDLAARCAQSPGDTRCNPNGAPLSTRDLDAQQGAALAREDAAAARVIVGAALLGVGGAGLVTGVVLLARAGRTGGFERPPDWQLTLRPDGAVARWRF